MNIIITGGNGFLGSRLAERFISKGHKVTCLDINSKSFKYRKNILKNAKFIKADITSKNSLDKVKISRNSVLLHCAGQPSAALSFKNPEDDCNKNINGMINIIKFAHKNSVKKIIFASTFNVYKENNSSPKLSENSLCQPKSLLSVSKFSAENYLRVFSSHLNIKWNILRMFNVYGPGQDPKNVNLGMISIFLNMAKKEPRIKLKGSIKRFRDFIYIDDVVDAWYKLTIDKKNFNKIYNLGSGNKVTLKTLFNHIGKVLNKKISIQVEKGTPGDFLGCYANINKIKKDLNFNPKVELKKGISKFNSWLDAETK